jgi:hypothetical protein
MTAAQDGGLPPPQLQQSIQDRIARRTMMQMPTLEVKLIGNRVVITGCVSCYYLKQLVLQGVIDAVGSAGTNEVEFNVQVVADPPRTVERLD